MGSESAILLKGGDDLSGGRQHAHLGNLIAAASIVPSLIPTVTIAGVALPLPDVLRWMGPGYWLRNAGAALILIGSIALLWSTRGTRGLGFEHRAEDTRV